MSDSLNFEPLSLVMSSQLEFHPYGVCVLRQYLSETEQVELYKYVLGIVNVPAKAAALQDASKRYVQLAMWNWPNRYGAMIADDGCASRPDKILELACAAKTRFVEGGACERVRAEFRFYACFSRRCHDMCV